MSLRGDFMRRLGAALSFDGRAGRAEYTRLLAPLLLFEAAYLTFLESVAPEGMGESPWFWPSFFLMVLPIALGAPVVLRRLHDIGRSAWWAFGFGIAVRVAIATLGLVGLEPIADGVGIGLILLALAWLAARPGAPGTNRFDAQQERDQRRCDAGWVRARMRQLAEPSLLLTLGAEERFSRLGGEPELPPDLAWPHGDDGPRTFVAQIDLAEARSRGGPEWLPRRGKLFAFYDPDGHGTPEVVRVLHSTQSAGPAAAPPPHTRWRFPERRVDFKPVTSLPSLEWIGARHHRLDDDDPDAWKEIAALDDAPAQDATQHRIGGFPNEVQDTQMALVCERTLRGLPTPDYQLDVTPELQQAPDEWRLLLQIDSDAALKMNWGDAGRLYVFVRKQDAAAEDFSKTVAIWESC